MLDKTQNRHNTVNRHADALSRRRLNQEHLQIAERCDQMFPQVSARVRAVIRKLRSQDSSNKVEIKRTEGSCKYKDSDSDGRTESEDDDMDSTCKSDEQKPARFYNQKQGAR